MRYPVLHEEERLRREVTARLVSAWIGGFGTALVLIFGIELFRRSF